MSRPGFCAIVAFLAAAALSAPAAPQSLATRAGSALTQRGLGPDALRLIDNVLTHEFTLPPLTPPIVLDLLRDPLAAVDATMLFDRTVPADVRAFADLAPTGPAQPFDTLLDAYIAELANAQAELMGAVAPFDEAALLRDLPTGIAAEKLVALAAAVDRERLALARRLFLETTARFVRALRAPGMQFPPPQRFQSAIGLVVIGSAGAERHAADAALIIDPGGNDVYERAPAMSGAISVVIDLDGDDRYEGSDVAVHALSAIVDVFGSDTYAASGAGLGAAIAGVSVLADLEGADSYVAEVFGQGAGLFGDGVLIDHRGNDRYRVRAFGQGYGGTGGLGLLWDQAGNDTYEASGLPDVYQRGGALSFAQGAAAGERDVLGGGIGILRDDAGDDRYRIDMFGQGTGYYFALGLLWDRAGDDEYNAVRYAQGNGVHQAVGVLREESGNDRYALSIGVGQGMGLDVALGVLYDAAGDDRYRANALAQASATANGLGLLADERGANTLEMNDHPLAWGEAQWFRHLPSVGLLLYDPAHAAFIRSGKPSGPSPPRIEYETEPPVACAGGDMQALLEDPERAVAEHGDRLPCLLQRGGPAFNERVRTLLRADTRCRARAFYLVTWGSAAQAQAALGEPCWRAQAAARERLKALGVAPLPAASTADFLRAE
jgi:hypothetical protein